MASTYKVLGQVNPASNTLTTLYTAPAATQTVVSTLVICNTAASGSTFRVAVRPAGASIATAHYIVYDTTIAANDTIFLTLGVTLAETDVISVQALASTVTFQAYGSEIA